MRMEDELPAIGIKGCSSNQNSFSFTLLVIFELRLLE